MGYVKILKTAAYHKRFQVRPDAARLAHGAPIF